MTAAALVPTDLTEQEAGALIEAERVIERGLKTFVEVGHALARIRDGRLYRTDYPSFETYCELRWTMSRPRAYQLISAAEIVSTTVDTGHRPPANEAQARELARVPKEQRAEVWREANERTNGRPTAEAVRGIVRERTAPAEPKAAPEPDSAPDPANACEACGVQMVEDQVAAGYMRCDDCDSEGEHYAVNFPYGRGGGCIGCHPELEQGYVPIGTPDDPVDAKARQKAEIAQSYRNLSDTLNAIPPERIAEINESVKPAVEFGQLVSACRQFAEMLARIDLDYAARGLDPDQLPTIRKTLDLARRVEQIIGASS